MTKTIQCPYCFERVEVWLDPQSEGVMIRDCEVCCRPWELHVTRLPDGSLDVRVMRAQ